MYSPVGEEFAQLSVSTWLRRFSEYYEVAADDDDGSGERPMCVSSAYIGVLRLGFPPRHAVLCIMQKVYFH